MPMRTFIRPKQQLLFLYGQDRLAFVKSTSRTHRMREESLFTVTTNSGVANFLCIVTSTYIFARIAMTITWYCHVYTFLITNIQKGYLPEKPLSSSKNPTNHPFQDNLHFDIPKSYRTPKEVLAESIVCSQIPLSCFHHNE